MIQALVDSGNVTELKERLSARISFGTAGLRGENFSFKEERRTKNEEEEGLTLTDFIDIFSLLPHFPGRMDAGFAHMNELTVVQASQVGGFLPAWLPFLLLLMACFFSRVCASISRALA